MPMMAEKEVISIGMGEMKVIKSQAATLCCVGLGSCLGFCAYDPVAKVGAMAHLVLPDSSSANGVFNEAKYVDTGIPLVLKELGKIGGIKSRTVIKIAGGARMFNIPGSNGALDVGTRNVDMAKNVLTASGMNRVAMDVGGNRGRTMTLQMDTGKVYVKTIGQENVEL